MPPETISFIVPVRNDAARLQVALESIHRNTCAATEIIVADNGSTDASAAVARRFGAVVLDLPGLRVSQMRNHAARIARGDVLAFVDADNEIAAEWIEVALNVLSAPDVGATGHLCVPPPGGNWVQHTYHLLRVSAPGQQDVEWLGSGNLAVRRELFLQIGGFDETLTTCEDVDLCARIRELGTRIVRDSRLRNIHHGDPATLGEVLRGEIWRGRDNLRVSLRPPLSWRTLASLGVSCAVLLGLVLVAAAPLCPAPSLVLAAGLLTAVGVVILRAWRMLRGQSIGAGLSVRHLFQTVLVATAYELGRALALVVRLPHRRPHPLSSAPAHV
jgi:hypothetical protein